MVLRAARECTRVRRLGTTREAQEGRGKGRVARCVRGRRDGGPLVVGLEVHVRAVGARLGLAVVLRRGHQVELGLHALRLVLLAQLRVRRQVEVAHLRTGFTGEI